MASGLCSELSSGLGVPLVGSAGVCDAVLAFELPPPWTPRLAGSKAGGPGFDAALAVLAAEAPAVRPLALQKDEEEAAGPLRRVLWFWKGPGAFAAFERREWLVHQDSLGPALEAIATGESGVPGQEVEPGAERDLLVCTHGSRDACCARFGYPLYRELAARIAAEAEAARTRVWRSSHLGGHRFAPTLLDLPSGRVFGRVRDAGVALGGAVLPAEIEGTYRGRVVLPEAAQVVEARLWSVLGKSFDGAGLRWSSHPDGEVFRVWMEASLRDGSRQVVRASVALDEPAAVSAPASCGRDPEPDAPWRLLSWEPVHDVEGETA